MNLMEVILKSWYVTFPLVACSIVLVMIIIERAVYFSKNKIQREDYFEKLNIILGSKPEELDHFVQTKNFYLNRVLAVALKNRGTSKEEMEEKMKLGAEKELSAVRRFRDWLRTLISIAPLMGLLGTVSGMIQAFAGISEGTDKTQLASYIQEALVTTAMGLTIAIPSIITFMIVKSFSDQFLDNLETIINSVPEKITSKR